jgi:pimeloyl-ACP methyl ester carboxylesterase
MDTAQKSPKHSATRWLKRGISGLLILVAAFILLIPAAGALAKSDLVKQNPPPGKLVNVIDHKLHLFCTGEGSPTVILESGLNDFYVSWAKVQPEISSLTRVCSYDRAGLGWSDQGLNPRTVDVMADELHTLLSEAGVGQPYILVGHSFGGIVARSFASLYPDEVVGVILVDSAHEEQGKRLTFLKKYAGRIVDQFTTFSLMSSIGLMALSPDSIPNRGLPDEAYKQYQAVLATTGYFKAAKAESTAFYSGKMNPPPALGDLPLIVLSHGLPDLSLNLTDTEQAQFEQEWTNMQHELVKLSTKSKQIIAQHSGHYIQLDQPELVVNAVNELIQDLKAH